MANLKEELDEYLNRNNDTKPLLNGLPSVNVSIPKVGSWFRKNETEEPEGWLAGARKDCCPTLSRLQKIMGFCICIGMGIFCFTLAAMYIPVLLLKARKFSLLYTMGSLFMISSFSFLWGPMTHLKHLFSRERFWFTFSYITTMGMTLYFALYQHSTPFTVLSAVFQLIALLWFLMSYIPGGQTGLLFSRNSALRRSQKLFLCNVTLTCHFIDCVFIDESGRRGMSKVFRITVCSVSV